MIFAENKRLTEPFSFIILKKLCSFLLIITLIYYTYDQFSQFSKSISIPNLTFRRKLVNVINDDDNINDIQKIFQNISIGMRICGVSCNTYSSDDCKDMPDTNCSLHRFDYQRKKIIEITFNITEAYLNLDYINIDNKKLYSTYQPPYINITNSLHNEQTNVVYYSPTIIKQITSKYAYGLAGGKEEEYVDFNIHMDHIVTPNKTTILLSPISMDIYYQEVTYYEFGSIISSIGGFFSSLAGIFGFLFGASKLAPWGFLQTHVFNCLCTRYRRKLVRRLKSKYEPIPFVSGRTTKRFTLEERVQSIENLLEEYYLDTDFLNLLVEENDDKV